MPPDPGLMQRRSHGVVRTALPIAELVAKHYLRLDVQGRENVSSEPTLYVANHNGGITGPDILCTLSVLWRELGPDAPLYALAHDFVMRHFRPVGSAIAPFGAVRATRDNAEHILSSGGSVLVYPGGDLDAYRSFARRNEVVIVPRTGFAGVARRTGVRIVPVVAEGAHRSAYIFHEGEGIARWLKKHLPTRLDRFPLALALPWGLALGPVVPYFPLPFRIRLRFLPPMRIEEDMSDLEAATDVQRVMQDAMDELVAT